MKNKIGFKIVPLVLSAGLLLSPVATWAQNDAGITQQQSRTGGTTGNDVGINNNGGSGTGTGTPSPSSFTPSNQSSTNSFTPSNQPSSTGIQLPSESETGLSSKSIKEILTNLLKWLILIFLIISVGAFVITGIMFVLAMGDSYSNAYKNAKNNFRYAVIALVIVGSSYIIITTINKLLSGTY